MSARAQPSSPARRPSSRRRCRVTSWCGRSGSPPGSTGSHRSSTPPRSRAPTAPAPTAGTTGRWRPSCAYRVRCSTWCSAGSGTSTRRGRPEREWRMTSSAEVGVSDPAAEPAAPPKPTFTWARLLQVVGGLGLAVFLLGWALPYFAHTTWADVWAVLQGIPATTAFGLFLLMVLGLWLYTFTITGSLPHLPHIKAFIVNVSGSAVGNLLPRRAISTSLIVTGVWNIMARLLLPIIGIGLMIFFAADLNPAVMRAAAVGAVGGIAVLAVFITMLASERACHRIGLWLEWSFGFVPFVRDSDPSLSQHILDQRTRPS